MEKSVTEKSRLGWSVGVVYRAWQSGMAEAAAEIPHGARGHQILDFVAEGSLPTQSELASHLGIDRTVLTYVLDDLVAAGLLERRTDDTDRRVRRLTVTASGVKRLVQWNERVLEAEAALFAGLADEDSEVLRRMLDRAAVAIHRGEPGHDECRAVIESIDRPARRI